MVQHAIRVLKAGPAGKFPDREDPVARLVSRLSAHMYSWQVAPDVLQAVLPSEENSY